MFARYMVALRCFATIKEFKPHIALIDIGMPMTDGYEIARSIKAASEGQEILLAAITGWGDDDHRQRGREAGFDSHFVKPITIDQLQNLLAASSPQRD